MTFTEDLAPYKLFTFYALILHIFTRLTFCIMMPSLIIMYEEKVVPSIPECMKKKNI